MNKKVLDGLRLYLVILGVFFIVVSVLGKSEADLGETEGASLDTAVVESVLKLEGIILMEKSMDTDKGCLNIKASLLRGEPQEESNPLSEEEVGAVRGLVEQTLVAYGYQKDQELGEILLMAKGTLSPEMPIRKTGRILVGIGRYIEMEAYVRSDALIELKWVYSGDVDEENPSEIISLKSVYLNMGLRPMKEGELNKVRADCWTAAARALVSFRAQTEEENQPMVMNLGNFEQLDDVEKLKVASELIFRWQGSHSDGTDVNASGLDFFRDIPDELLSRYPKVAAYLQNLKKVGVSEKLRAEAMEKLTRLYWEKEQE